MGETRGNLINAHEVWKSMLLSGNLDVKSLYTFAGIVTPIIENTTGLTVGYVSKWLDLNSIAVLEIQKKGSLCLLDTFDLNSKMRDMAEVEIWKLAQEWFEN